MYIINLIMYNKDFFYLFIQTLLALIFRTTLAVTPINNNSTNRMTSHQITRRQTSNEYACGIPPAYSNALVVNGQNVTHGEHPWVVALFARRSNGIIFQCGATLVSRSHVLTAAHCVSNNSPKDYVLKLGIHNIHDWGGGHIKIATIKRIQFHPEYDSSQVLQRDIAILILSDPVDYTPYIVPACLWEGNDALTEVVGQRGTVIGWGRDENGLITTAEPRKVTIPIVSTETCRGSRVEFHYFTNNMTLCAGDKQGSGPCNGDSGGGIFMRKERRWIIRGLVSNSLKAPNSDYCDLSEYVIFTDVAKYMPWIKEVIRYCDKTCDLNYCELPKPPIAGRYNILGTVSSPAGNIVPEHTVLHYSCDEEFTPSGTISICIKGVWTHTVECLRILDDHSRTEPSTTSTTTTTEFHFRLTGCTLPEYPKNGRYTVNGNSYEELIGSTVPEYTSLSYTCDNGYQLSNNDSNAICLPGGWTDVPNCIQTSIQPSIKGYCTVPVSDTVNFLCREDNQLKSCEDKVPVNTVVKYQCKRLHVLSGEEKNLLCLDSGVFDKPIPRCKAECGVESPIISFLNTEVSVAPWHVALYKPYIFSGGLQQYCGGTLISNKLFLTAARCVYDSTAKDVISPTQLSAAVGMIYRYWIDEENARRPHAQNLQVKSIHIPPSWTKQNWEHDIAVVEVENTIELYETVKPVCIDLSKDRFSIVKQPNNNNIGKYVYSSMMDAYRNSYRSEIGKIAGWNLENNRGVPSGLLQTLDMPVVDSDTCKRELDKYKFGEYVTPDTFCAGHLNKTLSSETFGGGLVFNVKVDDKDRWYIRGVASTMPSYSLSDHANTYAIFTEVYKMKDFLLQKLNELNFVW